MACAGAPLSRTQLRFPYALIVTPCVLPRATPLQALLGNPHSTGDVMAKFHIYLKGMADHSVITVDADRPPNLATSEPWIVVGKSSFRITEIVAIVAHEDIQHS